jgi:hypothetical protein
MKFRRYFQTNHAVHFVIFAKKRIMIQRVQTAFLVVSALLLSMLFRFPLADISYGGELYQFTIEGINKAGEQVYNGIPLIIFLSIILLLHIFVIFSYKKRILQMRVLGFTIILLLGLFGLFFYFAYSGFEGAAASFRIPVSFPVIAAILDYLAIRNIGKDEALIRSINRLRP